LFDSQQEKGGMIALTLNDYLQRGGIHKALERHADHTFAGFTEHEQELARSIFGGLIEVGRGTQDTKRTASFDELIPANAQRSDIEPIIHKLADARLITTDELEGKITVTISHEKLISSWTWLKKLVDENRDALTVQIEINNDAKEWNEHQRDDSFLYRGARLANAREKLEAKQLSLSGLAMEFIETAEKAYTDALEQEKKRADHLQKITNNAVARQLTMQAQTIIATQDPKKLIAVLLAIQSMKLFPTSEAAQILLTNDIFTRPITRIDGWFGRAVWSSDGRYVISTGFGFDPTVSVWEASTGKEITHFKLEGDVHSVIANPGGMYVITRADCIAIVWEVLTGKEVIRFTHDSSLSSVEFSPDGRFVISYMKDTVIVWETLTGKQVTRITDEDHPWSLGVAVSPNNKYLAVSNYHSAYVLEIATGSELTRIEQEDESRRVDFTPDGRFVVFGRDNGTSLIQEILVDEKIFHTVHENAVTPDTFSPDGKYAVSYRGGTPIVNEISTGDEVARLTYIENLNSVTISPDGRHVATGSLDGVARVWDVKTGKEVIRMTHESSVRTVAFSTDGKHVISQSYYTIQIWPVETSNSRLFHESEGDFTTISPDGKFMQVKQSDQKVCILECLSQAEVFCIVHDRDVNSVIFSPDSQYVISSGCDRVIRIGDNIDYEFQCTESSARVWDLSSGAEIARTNHTAEVKVITVSPDSKYAASGSEDHTVSILDITTGTEISRFTHDLRVYAIAFSPDGRLIISGSDDKSARVWDCATGKELARMTHENEVYAVAFSPDGKHVISGGIDKTARVWEATTGKEIARMTHDEDVRGVVFSPDGNFVASGAPSRIWESMTGKEIARLALGTSSVVFSADGKFMRGAVYPNIIRAAKWQPDDLIATSSRSMPRNLTRAEWKQYIGDALPYQAICEDLPIEPEATSS
jgi:WD40 repeat protein